MGKEDLDEIRFIAALPPIQSAINIDGMGDGARIKLDIPRTEMVAMLKLQTFTGEAFDVTIKRREQPPRIEPDKINNDETERRTWRS